MPDLVILCYNFDPQNSNNNKQDAQNYPDYGKDVCRLKSQILRCYSLQELSHKFDRFLMSRLYVEQHEEYQANNMD